VKQQQGLSVNVPLQYLVIHVVQQCDWLSASDVQSQSPFAHVHGIPTSSLRTMQFIRFAFLLLLFNGLAVSQDVASHLARGDAAQLQMKADVALAAYRDAEKLEPRNVETLWRISKVLSDFAADESDEARAKQFLRRALSYATCAVHIDSSHAMAWVSLAIVHGQLAVIAPVADKLELSKKIQQYSSRALELDHSNHPAMLVLGMWNREIASLSWIVRLTVRLVYGGVPDASLEESQRLLTAAAALRPDDIMSRVELAKTLIELKEKNEAMMHLRKSLALPLRDVGDPRRQEEARKLLRELT